jgi:predicted HTH transcriptional regulator
MEELGTGVVRMKQAMLDHGLKQPEYSLRENCLVVTFRGPGADMSKLKTDHSVPVFDVRPSVVETLNRSQKAILHELLQKGQVRVAELTIDLGVTAQAVRKDLAKLHKLGLIEQRGAARATYYVLNERQLHESATIRNL